MPISDVFTARSGAFSTTTITTAQPFLSLISPATKRAWIVGVRVDVGVTTAAAGNSLLFQLSRPAASNTATSLAVVTGGHDFSAPSSISSFATTWSTAPTVATAAGGILWEQELPQTTGSSWEEFPPSGYEWQVPAIATGAANSGVHAFVTQSVGTATPVYIDLVFSE
jgi:hypothetical protein